MSTIALIRREKAVGKDQVSAIFREGLIYNGLVGSGLFKEKRICIDIPGMQFIVN